MTNAGGTQIGTDSYNWSSSEYFSGNAWGSDFSLDYGLGGDDDRYTTKRYSNDVRPVLEF